MFKILIKIKNFKDRVKILWLYLLTLSRIFFAFFFFFIFTKLNRYDDKFLYLIGLILVIIIELTDILDGYLARKLNLVTFAGGVIDPFSDSISRLIVFGTLAYKNLCFAFVPIIMVLRDISVAYTRIAQISYSIDCSARLSGKLKAFLQGISSIVLTSLPLFDFSSIVKQKIILFLSYLVVIIVIYSMFDYILSTLLKYKKLTIEKKQQYDNINKRIY